jgi:ribosomal protein S18 acetylase RimI-like enzyme
MITIKQGTTKDIPFLVDAIIQAEKSGTSVLSYSKIFLIPENQMEAILSEILQEEIDGFELCPVNFLIAFEDAVPVGCVSSWIEAKSGLSSSILKSNAFFYFIPKKNLAGIEKNIKTIESLNLSREAGTLQLESIYTNPLYRERGISALLINRHIQNFKLSNPELEKAQIQLMGENGKAISAYQKAGFRITMTRHSEDPMILEFLPGNTRILMEKEI